MICAVMTYVVSGQTWNRRERKLTLSLCGVGDEFGELRRLQHE